MNSQTKVLIIDNSEDLLDAFKFFLESAGYLARCMLAADSILQEIDNYEPDIILLDVRLDKGDGRVICKELKRNPSYSSIPVLLMSADPESLEKFADCKADGIIEKPFNLTEVISKIQSVLLNTSII